MQHTPKPSWPGGHAGSPRSEAASRRDPIQFPRRPARAAQSPEPRHLDLGVPPGTSMFLSGPGCLRPGKPQARSLEHRPGGSQRQGGRVRCRVRCPQPRPHTGGRRASARRRRPGPRRCGGGTGCGPGGQGACVLTDQPHSEQQLSVRRLSRSHLQPPRADPAPDLGPRPPPGSALL